MAWLDTWARLFQCADAAKEKAKADFLAALDPPNPSRVPDGQVIPLVDAIVTAQWKALLKHIGPVSSDDSISIGIKETSDPVPVPQLDLKTSRSGGGAYVTAYAVDFTTLPSQNLLTGGDGDKTIAGRTWRLVNSANLAVADVGVQGLRLKCNTNLSINYSTTLSAGAIYGAFDAFSEALSLDHSSETTEVWVWYHIDITHTPSADFEATETGVLWSALDYTYNRNVRYSIGEGFNSLDGDLSRPRTHYGHGVNGDSYGSGKVPSERYDICAFRIRSGTIEAFSGKSVFGNFPARNTLIYRGRAQLTNYTGIVGNQKASAEDGFRAWFSVQSGNTAGLQDLTVKKMLIESATVGFASGAADEDFYGVSISATGEILSFGLHRNLLVGGGGSYSLVGIDYTTAAGGTKLSLTFTEDTVIAAMGSPAAGAKIRTPRYGADEPQELHVKANDFVLLQLRTDTATPFWNVIGGSFT